MTLANETAANFEAFFQSWTSQASANWEELHKEDQFLTSYRRIAAFQAVKIDLILPDFSEGSAAFLQEAHNDALVSHVSASYGAWRSALKSLRSVIENSLAALYYSDHPIELLNWQRGKRKNSASEFIKYFQEHPALDNVSEDVSGLTRIKGEYATLSKAVHASTVDFRMTDNVSKVLLWNKEKKRLGQWSTRERETLSGVMQLTVSLFAAKLAGAQRSQLRESLGYLFAQNIRSKLKAELQITIPTPT